MAVWNCNWQVALDNRVDPIHGSFLHEGTYTLSGGRKDAELKVVETPTGFETFRSNQKNVNIDWHEVVYHPENIFWIRTEIPSPKQFGGGTFRINGHPTPIDKNVDTGLVFSLAKGFRLAARYVEVSLQKQDRKAVLFILLIKIVSC